MRMGSPPATRRSEELKSLPSGSDPGGWAGIAPDLDAIATGCVGELRRVLAALKADDLDLVARLAVEGTVLRRDPAAPKPKGSPEWGWQ